MTTVPADLTPTNGMVKPWYWNMGDNEFITYNNALGFVETSAQLPSLAAAAIRWYKLGVVQRGALFEGEHHIVAE